MIAGLHVGYLFADFFDDSGGLVAEHRGRRVRVETVNEMQVAMAYAAGDGLDQDFAVLRLVEFDVVDTERLIGPVENGGFHSDCSLSVAIVLAARAGNEKRKAKNGKRETSCAARLRLPYYHTGGAFPVRDFAAPMTGLRKHRRPGCAHERNALELGGS